MVPADAAIATALDTFVGSFEQRPPAFSARKQAGRTAYRAARAGEPLDLPSRPVTVDAIDLLGVDRRDGHTDVRIDLRCGPGTYIRSIARDLGDLLGCGGHLASLRRTEAAGLRAEDALPPERLEALAAAGRLGDAILPVADLLPLPAVTLTPDAAWRFLHGSEQPSAGPAGAVKVIDSGGVLLGVGSVADGVLRPQKVLPGDAAA
jgi:tRNA pseudouridine55 synthase